MMSTLKEDKMICSCFYTNNYFIKSLKCHVSFRGRQEFISYYGDFLSERCSPEEIEAIVEQVEAELSRRRSLFSLAAERQLIINTTYTRLHEHVYHLQEDYLCREFIELVELCRHDNVSNSDIIARLKLVPGTQSVFQFPVFTSEFCRQLMEELSHFEADSAQPKGRPNTMNKYGILLAELGFNECLLNPLRERYLSPVAGRLFADCVGSTLDSHRAFIVSYNNDIDGADLDLHYDNAEVTLNVSLDAEFEGGEVYFGSMFNAASPLQSASPPRYAIGQHCLGFGLLHRGLQLHGALPVTNGSRHNLIVWMRSSTVRNQLCPMCQLKPQLVETEGPGDGFTNTPVAVQVCCSS